MRKRDRSRRAVSVVGAACLAAIGAASGCSSASHDAATGKSAAATAGATQTQNPEPSMTISQALAEIPDTGWNESFLAFSATATVAKLNGSSDMGPYASLLPLINELVILPDAKDEQQQTTLLGFDPLKAPFTVSMIARTGASDPHPAAVLFGAYDPGAIVRKLTATGYASHGTTGGTALWLHAANSDTKLYPMVGEVEIPTAVGISPARLVMSTDLDTVDSLLAPKAAVLSAKSNLKAMADCLGPAVFGIIGSHLYGPNQTFLTPASSVGVIPSGGKTTFEVCVAAADPAAAQAMETRWITQIGTGTMGDSTEKWSSYYLDPQASVSSTSQHLVRLTAVLNTQHGEDPGRAVEEYLAGATAAALGITK